MSQQEVLDEETPLLQPVQQKKARTPLPWRDLSLRTPETSASQMAMKPA
ncbi:hypothetical protein AZE42_11702 [Rhizopogon vesiculosus]|uniref:Uncharacterized protein n=1 Tax=Rhizopogon vesiculosus TaxID=180088 RepID=A0A1J8Q2N2_9AGAM|nr:hypothetical protein AZE42_11702 [Rhizopogon vesiculosus]